MPIIHVYDGETTNRNVRKRTVDCLPNNDFYLVEIELTQAVDTAQLATDSEVLEAHVFLIKGKS